MRLPATNTIYICVLVQGMNTKRQILITTSYPGPDWSESSLSPWYHLYSVHLLAFILDVDSPSKGNYQFRRKMEAQAPAAKHKAPPPGEEPQPEHLIPA